MNIQFFLQQIHSTGLSDEQIGKLIAAPQATVWRLRTGKHKSTDFERGTKIHSLYKQIIKNKAA